MRPLNVQTNEDTKRAQAVRSMIQKQKEIINSGIVQIIITNTN